MAARQALFGGARRAGYLYAGMNEQESAQFMGQVAQAGEGGIEDVGRQGMIGTAFAARRLYGVSAETSGMFVRAGRRGGLAGMQGTGAELMSQVIADAMAMGLKGSQITSYLQEIASGIQQFDTSGMPIAERSIASMGVSLSTVGFRGGRAAALARGVTGAAQGLSRRGPQNAAELLLLQQLGGFEGGGAEGFERAQLRLEQGEFGGAEMQRLFSRFMRAGGGGAAGRGLFRASMRGFGVNIGVKETMLMDRIRTGSATEEDRKELAQIEDARLRVETEGGAMGKGAPKGPADIMAQARKMLDDYGANVRRAADISNRQRVAGEQMLPALQNLESSTTNVNKAFSELVSGPLKSFSGMVESASKSIAAFASGLSAASAGGSVFDRWFEGAD